MTMKFVEPDVSALDIENVFNAKYPRYAGELKVSLDNVVITLAFRNIYCERNVAELMTGPGVIFTEKEYFWMNVLNTISRMVTYYEKM